MTVQRGDSLWKLAHQFLGRGNRWPELLAANRGIANPNQIHVGAHLELPVAGLTLAATRTASGNSLITIKVLKGDTLWSLAKSHLGRSSYWPCLAAANHLLANPNLIYQDQELIVPAGCSP